jgi:glutaredoxin 2
MPTGIFLYTITSSSEPQIIIDYYLTKPSVPSTILQKLYKKHTKGIIDATIQEGEIKFYSSMVEEKKNLFLGFILKKDEDIISLKTIFEEIEDKVSHNYGSIDKQKMKKYLKETLDSITNLLEKLKNPEIIREKLNKRTKKLLDENKIEEAKKLIDLGEKIPAEVSQLIEDAEAYFKEENFKKSKKRFLKAADLAELIQENQIAAFLKNKAEKVANFPKLLEEREDIRKEIRDQFDDLQNLHNLLQNYGVIIPYIKRLMEISNIFNQNERYLKLSKILNELKRATRLSEQLREINTDLIKSEFFD